MLNILDGVWDNSMVTEWTKIRKWLFWGPDYSKDLGAVIAINLLTYYLSMWTFYWQHPDVGKNTFNSAKTQHSK